MNKVMAQQLLEEHRVKLAETKKSLVRRSNGAAEEAVKTVLPMLEAQTELIQNVLDCI